MTGANHLVNINITFRNIDATDSLKNYVNEKISHCLQKFIHRDTEAHVVLKVEKNRKIAEVTLNGDGAPIHATEESGDLYASIDALVDTLAQQMRKNKEKLVKHH